MADYGIKVSKEGADVTSTEPKDYIFNSAYSAVKIALQGSDSVVIASGATEVVTIAHGLSFTPLALIYTELSPGSGKWFVGMTKLNTGDADAGDVYTDAGLDGSGNPVESYTDSTNLIISYTNGGASSKTVNYYYIIFGDSGT